MPRSASVISKSLDVGGPGQGGFRYSDKVSISIGYCIGSTSRYRYLNDTSWHYGTCAIITSGREVQACLDLLRLYYSIAMAPNPESSINKSLTFSLKKSRFVSNALSTPLFQDFQLLSAPFPIRPYGVFPKKFALVHRS